MTNIELYKHAPGVTEESPIYPIYQKVMAGERISENEALLLFKSDNIHDIAHIARLVQYRWNENKIHYVLNGHINYSNICAIKCSFCSFSKKNGDEGAYAMSLDEIKNKFLQFNQDQIREIHIVGGLHPDKPLDYYSSMIETIRSLNPDITIKAFTAVEIEYFSRQFAMPVREVLTTLMKAGLGALPGGGAEIFAEKIRKKICPTKIDAAKWLEVHETAHELGLKSNATLLFGHIESYEDRVDHLKRLRDLQDKTGGFLCLIPLTYHPEANPLCDTRTTGIDELKTIAVSRIFLDNFPHIKAYWVMLGVKLAQMALSFGADDLDGTVIEEKITHAAGGQSPQALSRVELRKLITDCGKVPVERDSFYYEITC